MSNRRGHPHLSSVGYAWLSAVSDPEMSQPIPRGPMAQDELSALVEAADAHGVLPVATRNLRKCLTTWGAKSVVSGRNAEEILVRILHELDQRVIIITGQCLLLAHYERQICLEMKKSALRAAVVKGPVFARRLYANRSDRSFTDIDILLDPAALQAMAEILRRLGFAELGSANQPAGAQSEFKWFLPGNDSILIELQTNLIHSAGADPGIRLTYADLVTAGEGDPEDANAVLLVAAVHAIASHQLERLQPAVDVLQAVRGKAGPIDLATLIRAACATGATTALQTALDIVASIFHEPQASQLADLLTPSRWRRLRAKLLPPAVVLRSQAVHAGRDSWRRRAIRKLVR